MAAWIKFVAVKELDVEIGAAPPCHFFEELPRRNQVFDHVAKPVLKAMRVVTAGDGRAAVALPDNVDHRREIDQIGNALHTAGIGVFLVSESEEVRLESPWAF